jgi:hypothetical protein
MTYRGVVRNGVVELEPDVRLPDGTPVEVTTSTPSAESLSKLPAFGMWADRQDTSDAAAASLRLREQLMKRGQ